MSLTSNLFLCVSIGDIVYVEEILSVFDRDTLGWIGRIMYIVSGPRDPCSNSIFQVENVDTGVIKYVNADLVKLIVRKSSEQ